MGLRGACLGASAVYLPGQACPPEEMTCVSVPADPSTSVVVASYPEYRLAEEAVDRLSDNDFPVDRVSIIGRDLQFVERVTGRFGWLDAALRGLLTGAIAGVLIGWLFFVFDWFSPVVARGWLILDGLWFGAVVGLVMGLLMYALTRGRRDFASIGTLTATRYDVVVDPSVAEEALRVLAGHRDPHLSDARFSRTPEGQARPNDPVRPRT
jgi:hypothetical protein